MRICSLILIVLSRNSSLPVRHFSCSGYSSYSKNKSKMKRVQPTWTPPPPHEGIEYPPLKLFNSLTGNKEQFRPQNGKTVTWYSCGPTVYDMSHMGHARCYMSFDILRRVLRDYFKYDVNYVMNITDIDDKIIKRARQGYLFKEYSANTPPMDQLKTDVAAALERVQGKLAKETDPDKKQMLEREVARVHKALNDADESLLTVAKDALSDWLDSKLGSTVTDNAIFMDLPTHFENEFHTDMDALNILRPDILTRVREYIPQIVEYVKKIIDNKFAYESNQSVYFDTAKFASTEGHFYAKLVPTAYGDQMMLQEGEGDLSSAVDTQTEKRSINDFALWKASKPGEPAWDSPWGRGRPGWHIECSVMASDVIGESLDIHTGGVDLKFPHHDNEMAQAEAYYCHSHWVRYFLHAGHLTISGCKMSKSLKNFITIREALTMSSARRLRLAFLLHSWKDTLDYSEGTMTEAASYEKLLIDFLYTVKYHLDLVKCDRISMEGSGDENDLELQTAVDMAKSKVHDALCDSIDTREANTVIRELIGQCNIYLREKELANQPVAPKILKEAAVFISKMMKIFGAASGDSSVETIELDTLTAVQSQGLARDLFQVLAQFKDGVLKAAHTAGCADIEDLVEKMRSVILEQFGVDLNDANMNPSNSVSLPDLLISLSTWRENIRQSAKTSKTGSVLSECDKLRDSLLPDLGVRLQDKDEGFPPAVGLVPKDILLEERDKKTKQMDQKRLEMQAKKEEKEAQMKINPLEMFTSQTDKYSQFDAEGIPTHDAEGKELSKSQAKNLRKQHAAQSKKYSEYLKIKSGGD